MLCRITAVPERELSSGIVAGDTVKILSINGEEYRIQREMPGKGSTAAYCSAGLLVPLDKTAASRPRVGQLVRVVGGGTRMGETGTLIEDDGSSVPFKVKFPDTDTRWVYAKNVALATAAEKAAAEKAAADRAAAERAASESMFRRAISWLGLPDAHKVRVEEKANRALEEDGFALRPLLESDASVLLSLKALLQTEHPEWLGKGQDVSEDYGPYDSLKLACAWKVDHQRNLEKYTAGVKRVQKEMDLLKKKGKDVDKVPGLPVRTARAAEDFTMKAGANEAILLHGTSPERLLELLSTGLNERYSGTNAGTAFGDGVYLAEDVGKTDQYVSADSAYDPSSELHKRLYGRTMRHPGDVFYVLVVRAALGYPVRTQQKGRKATSMDNLAPIFPIGFRELSAVQGVIPPIYHHSLIAELGSAIVRYREFVLFHSEYVHIDYVIAYHRCDGGQKLSTTMDNPFMA
jgi:hypothetical protein